MIYLVITALCYTVCTVSDKYAISEYRLSSSDFTFLMAAASCICMIPALFLTEMRFELSVSSFITVALVTADKIVEFYTSAAVLKRLSGFETKAWLGTAMFLSYFTDVAVFGEGFEVVKLLFIFITCGCLFIMVRGGRNSSKGKYKGIVLLLVLYILSKFFYGLVIRLGSDAVSPTASVYSAMVIIAVIYLFKVNLKELFKDKLKGSGIVFATRIPNIIGLISENTLIGVSLTLYSMEQPLILAMLLAYSFIRRENESKVSLISGAVCLLAILAFRLV